MEKAQLERVYEQAYRYYVEREYGKAKTVLSEYSQGSSSGGSGSESNDNIKQLLEAITCAERNGRGINEGIDNDNDNDNDSVVFEEEEEEEGVEEEGIWGNKGDNYGDNNGDKGDKGDKGDSGGDTGDTHGDIATTAPSSALTAAAIAAAIAGSVVIAGGVYRYLRAYRRLKK